MTHRPPHPPQLDVVLEGGGVKGIGLVGTLVRLLERGYELRRIAGTSAGAVVGSIAAAGLTSDKLKEVALSLNYAKFLDPRPIERIPVAGPGLAALTGGGLFRGDYAHEWFRKTLAELGIHTFADLKLDDPALPENRRYKLVVTAADLTLGRLVYLPWDYEAVYGLDPDEIEVADAVRASMSIPFFFTPTTLTNPQTGVTSTLVDGGVLSNFPIDCLDRPDGKMPRWPTFGITLLPNLPAGDDGVVPLLRIPHPGGPHLLEQVVATMLVGRDQCHLGLPWVEARAIRIDTTKVGVVDFGIGAAETEALYQRGYEAAEDFLATWDWEQYVKRFRGEVTGERTSVTVVVNPA